MKRLGDPYSKCLESSDERFKAKYGLTYTREVILNMLRASKCKMKLIKLKQPFFSSTVHIMTFNFEFFAFNTKFPEMAMLASKDFTASKTSYLQLGLP